MQTEKIIMRESPEAASIQAVTGWVSSTGRFWGDDERTARYDGSTHQQCGTNPDHPIHKTNSYCSTCREERMQEKFEAMPSRLWDGTEPVMIYDSDLYFFDAESLRDHMTDNDITAEDLRLVFCRPNIARVIDPNEHFADDLCEDGEVSAELSAAFDALNAVIERQAPLSWSAGKEVALLPNGFIGDAQAQ